METVNRYFYFSLAILSIFLVTTISSTENQYDGPLSTTSYHSTYDGPLSISLYHSTRQGSEPEWKERGEINVQNVLTGEAIFSQEHVDSQTIKELLALAKRDGLYHLKAVVKTTKGREISFLTFVKACLLVESGLNDALTASIDQSGSVIAVTLSSTISVCENRHVSPSELVDFNTSVLYRNIEQGPIPDTASYIQKIEREREAREHGETKDTRSFLSKYWMYIVPVVIFVVLSGASNPDGQAAAR